MGRGGWWAAHTRVDIPPTGMDSFFEELKSFGERIEEESIVDAILAFSHAVNWREPFVLCLICFHVCMYIAAWVSRRHTHATASIFLFVLLLVYCAQPLNSAAASHWQIIATQNYFDRSGIFASVLFCGPLLLLSMLLLLNMILESSRLLVKVKRAELRSHARSQRVFKQE